MTEKKKYKPTICIDFDGVLHSYTSGWKGADVITDPPVPGALKWLITAVESEKAIIAIYSSRSKEPGGVDAMTHWLFNEISRMYWKNTEFDLADAQAFIEKLSFPTQKPAANMTIDDRAHCFNGRFRPLEWYMNFKPWNKRSPEQNVPDYAQPGYKSDWSQEDEDLADQSLECIVNCLVTDKDGFVTIEPSGQEYLASMFREARLGDKKYTDKHTRDSELRRVIFDTLTNEECSSKCLDSSDDRYIVIEELLRAIKDV